MMNPPITNNKITDIGKLSINEVICATGLFWEEDKGIVFQCLVYRETYHSFVRYLAIIAAM